MENGATLTGRILLGQLFLLTGFNKISGYAATAAGRGVSMQSWRNETLLRAAWWHSS